MQCMTQYYFYKINIVILDEGILYNYVLLCHFQINWNASHIHKNLIWQGIRYVTDELSRTVDSRRRQVLKMRYLTQSLVSVASSCRERANNESNERIVPGKNRMKIIWKYDRKIWWEYNGPIGKWQRDDTKMLSNTYIYIMKTKAILGMGQYEYVVGVNIIIL